MCAPARPAAIQVPHHFVDAEWQLEEDAGGALRIYVDGDDAQGEGVDVAPTGDRLVCFFADRVVHEVLPAAADRWALTLWFVGNDAECAANRAGAELRAAHFPPG